MQCSKCTETLGIRSLFSGYAAVAIGKKPVAVTGPIARIFLSALYIIEG